MEQIEEKDIFQQSIDYLKSGNYKKSSDARNILQIMLTKLSFFSDFDNDPIFNSYAQKCIDMLEYQVYQQDEPVFLYGERGDTVYFVLKGQAAIFIPRNESEKLNAFKIQNKFNKNKKKCNTYKNSDKEQHYQNKFQRYTSLIQQCLENAKNEYSNQGSRQVGNHIYRIVHITQQGGQFGELSVLFGKNRGATVAAFNGPLHLIGIKGSDYLNIFSNILEQLNYVLFCLQSTFPSARKTVLATLANCFSIKKRYRLNEPIYYEGEFSNYIYIVKKGSVGLRKTICEHKKQEIIREISFINENQFFGHEAMLLHNPLRIATAVSTYYDTVVLGINKIAFNKVLLGQQDQQEMRLYARTAIEGYIHKSNQLYEQYIASLNQFGGKKTQNFEKQSTYYSKGISLQIFESKQNQMVGVIQESIQNPHLTVENFQKYKQHTFGSSQSQQSLNENEKNQNKESAKTYVDDMNIVQNKNDQVKAEQQTDNRKKNSKNKKMKDANKSKTTKLNDNNNNVRLPEIEVKVQFNPNDALELMKYDNLRKQLTSQNFRISKLKLQGYHNNYQDEAKVFLQQQLEHHFTFKNPLKQASPLRLSSITEQQFQKTITNKLSPLTNTHQDQQKTQKLDQQIEVKSDQPKINTYQQFFNVVQNRLANKNKKHTESSFVQSERSKDELNKQYDDIVEKKKKDKKEILSEGENNTNMSTQQQQSKHFTNNSNNNNNINNPNK